MSISSTLSNALSGLTAASRAAEIVSSNLANTRTQGYGRRELHLSSEVVGGNSAGVRVDGVVRVVDRGLLADRRIADAGYGFSNTTTQFLTRIEQTVGIPGDAGSLADRILQLENALLESASTPTSQLRLEAVGDALGDVANELNRMTDVIQDQRMQAEADIANQVDSLNANLAQIAQLNEDIITTTSAGRDPSALIDQRQVAIDAVAEIIPVREVERELGRVALFTPMGAALIDGQPATFEFTQSNYITADLSVDAGHLSQISMNGVEIPLGSSASRLGGGTLAAGFTVRDELAVEAQSSLDAVARDLAERFQGSTVDPTQTATDAGIFTDRGALFDATDETGFAGRIRLNGLIDQVMGGDVTLLREGLGATTAGAPGDATQIQSWLSALTDERTQPDGREQTAYGLVTDISSRIGTDRAAAETTLSYATARADQLRQLELADGVDMDAEMQNLLLIEQAYSANARVIATVDEMIQTLLRL